MVGPTGDNFFAIFEAIFSCIRLICPFVLSASNFVVYNIGTHCEIKMAEQQLLTRVANSIEDAS
jgi:hypothetical protein